MSQSSQTVKKPGMLIVEDHAMMRATLRAFLNLKLPEHAIHEAADGRSALAAVREHRPELVLMDVSLPDANGLDLTAQIIKAFPRTVVIVVTQHEGEYYRDHARRVGAFGYVVKDALNVELVPLIVQALGRTAGIPKE